MKRYEHQPRPEAGADARRGNGSSRDDMVDQGDYLKRLGLYTRLLAERAGGFRVEAIMTPRRPFQWRLYDVDSPTIVEIIAPDYSQVSTIHRLSKDSQRVFLQSFLEVSSQKLKERLNRPEGEQC